MKLKMISNYLEIDILNHENAILTLIEGIEKTHVYYAHLYRTTSLFAADEGTARKIWYSTGHY